MPRLHDYVWTTAIAFLRHPNADPVSAHHSAIVPIPQSTLPPSRSVSLAPFAGTSGRLSPSHDQCQGLVFAPTRARDQALPKLCPTGSRLGTAAGRSIARTG